MGDFDKQSVLSRGSELNSLVPYIRFSTGNDMYDFTLIIFSVVNVFYLKAFFRSFLLLKRFAVFFFYNYFS